MRRPFGAFSSKRIIKRNVTLDAPIIKCGIVKVIRMGRSTRHIDECRQIAENDQVFTKTLAKGSWRRGPEILYIIMFFF